MLTTRTDPYVNARSSSTCISSLSEPEHLSFEIWNEGKSQCFWCLQVTSRGREQSSWVSCFPGWWGGMKGQWDGGRRGIWGNGRLRWSDKNMLPQDACLYSAHWSFWLRSRSSSRVLVHLWRDEMQILTAMGYLASNLQKSWPPCLNMTTRRIFQRLVNAFQITKPSWIIGFLPC